MILNIDVKNIGPQQSSIGLSHLNKFVFELFGVNILWYNITDWLGLIPFFVGLIFAILGLVQWIKRKYIYLVDKEILTLGGLYIIIIGLYIFFENIIINYRPVIMPNCKNLEASFPSSHTMLVCVVMGSAIMIISKYIKTNWFCKTLKFISYLIILITVIGRLISGVHWFTDIIGGILISISLLTIFSVIINKGDLKK